MSNPITIDTTKFKSKLTGIIKAAPVEPEKIIRHQGALLIKELTDQALPKNITKMKAAAKVTVLRAFRPSATGRAAVLLKRYHFVRKVEGKQKTGRPVNVQPAAIDAFVKLQQNRAGLLAAGWIANGNPLHASVKATVKKQKSYGRYEEKKLALGLRITITNAVAFAQKAFGSTYPRKVQAAVDKRARFMGSLLRYWTKSGRVRYTLPAWLR